MQPSLSITTRETTYTATVVMLYSSGRQQTKRFRRGQMSATRSAQLWIEEQLNGIREHCYAEHMELPIVTIDGTPHVWKPLITRQTLTVREERLLAYLETCVVDYQGQFDRRGVRVGAEELQIIDTWDRAGFIKAYLCHDTVAFSDDAYTIAAKLRRERAERGHEAFILRHAAQLANAIANPTNSE
jgi:hypothetical protein